MVKRFATWRGAACALGLVAVLLAPGAALAAPVVTSARAEIEVDPGGTRVVLHYAVQDDGSTDAVAMSLLRVGGTQVRDLTVTAGGQPVTAETSERGPAMTVRVPVSTPGGGGTFEFSAEYVVDGSVAGSGGNRQQVMVPILAPTLAPTGENDVFQAVVQLAPGMAFVEGFPVAPAAMESTAGATIVRYSNPVVPSMIRAVVSPGAVPFLTFNRAMDLLVLVVLLVGAYGAYRAMTANRQPAGQAVD